MGRLRLPRKPLEADRDHGVAGVKTRAAAALCATMAILGLSLAAGLDVGRVAWGSGDWIGRISLNWAVAFGLFALGVGILNLAVLFGVWKPDKLLAVLDGLSRRLFRFRFLRWPIVVACILLPTILTYYTSFGILFPGLSVRLVVLVGCLALAWTVGGGFAANRSRGLLPAFVLAMGAALALGREFASVTSYPFSLSWSEGNRLWDYSLAFGRSRYILPAGDQLFAYISPGRQALWGLPFLIPQASILLVRLWSAILFTLPFALLGWVLVRRDGGDQSRTWELAFAAWGFLFLAQGPVYTPLVLSAIVVALAVRLRSAWIGAVLVGLASYYAYDSRWTWLLAPGAWAGLVTVIEEPLIVNRRWQMPRVWRTMIFAAGGVLGGYVAPTVVARLTQGAGPTGVSDVGGALTRQPLLWYRLLPNPTYGLGVILALLLVGGPTIAVLVWLLKKRAWVLDRWQLAAVAGVLVAFLVAGVIVSVKIGGGSNLHNLDMFLLTLAFLAAWAFRGPAGRERLRSVLGHTAGRWLLVSALAFPTALTVASGGPLALPEKSVVADSLQAVRREVAAALPHGEILFYDQRQLLTFGFVKGVPLVSEYEKKYMTDQSLSGDTAFFEPFYVDLARHRFALIVSPPLETTWQEEHPFSEEDEAQVRFLYLPMAKYYEPALRLDAVGVWLLRPRQGS
jgi:hypothetical protein